MDEQAVAEDERAAGRNVMASVLATVTGKRLEAKGIRRQQAVRPSVPVRRSSQVIGMIKDRETDILGCHAAKVVDPVRTLAPDRLFSAGAARIHHVTGWRVQGLHDTDRKRALLG